MTQQVAVDDAKIMDQARRCGISTQYVDAQGKTQHIDERALSSVLSAIGEVSSQPCAMAKTESRRVNCEYLPWQAGEKIRWQIHGMNAEIQGESVLCDDQTGLYFEFDAPIQAGYYQLSLSQSLTVAAQSSVKSLCLLLLVAPNRCYLPPLVAEGRRIWGVNIQLYSLRTEQNWGIGDFGDVRQLLGEIAERGGDFVGLNPLHALFLTHPNMNSPYSPSSRYWLNPLYIDVATIEDFSSSSDAQDFVGSHEVQKQLSTLRGLDYVDYPAVTALKMRVFELLFQSFQTLHLALNSRRASAFHRFVAQGGSSLLDFACYQVLQEQYGAQHHGPSWHHFPETLQQPQSQACEQFRITHQERINFYCYLQWLADEQLQSLQRYSQQMGMAIGLYRDLAVGTSSDGVECWSEPELFWSQVSVGAPPDALAPQGQNWGLPPFSIDALQTQQYEPFIKLIRRNMQACGALRIDHILGLMRLWLVPQNEAASQGAYVDMPFEQLMAIIAIESHQQQCMVIGEDLGTVPQTLRQRLSEMAIFSYKVLLFEIAPDGGYYSPSHYQSDAIAAVCTHDMPTLKGYWHCDDLRLAESLGIFPQSDMAEQFDGRAHNKQRLLESLNWHGHLSDDINRDANQQAMTWSLMAAIHYHLACGRSQMMSIQLEDLLMMDTPVNVPGTFDEYPNWQRKLNQSLTSLFDKSQVNQLLAKLTQLRQQNIELSP